MATTVSKEYGAAFLDQLETLFPGGFDIALLTSAPTVSSGTLSIASAELSNVTSNGYARIAVPSADFTAASGNNPVTRSNENALVSEYNGGVSDWQPINYVAVLDASDDTVLLVVSTAAPVTIAVGRRARIPAGALTLRMASA